MEHLKVFGYQAYAYIEKQHRSKLDPKSHLCYYLEYCDNTKCYWLWDPVTSKVLLRNDMIFNEQLIYGNAVVQFVTSSTLVTLPYDTASFTKKFHHNNDLPNSSPFSSHSSCSFLEPTLINDHVITPSSPSTNDTGCTENSPEYFVSLFPLTPRVFLSHPNYQTDTPIRLRPLAEIENIAPSSSFSDTTPPLPRAHLIHTIPNSSPIISSPPFESATPSSSSSNPITVDFFPDDPFTYHEALQSLDVAHWIHAMTDEIHSLKENKTWDLVHLPNGQKAIKCKWVFKIKYLPNGIVDKFKARLLAKGCTQKVGIDYSETFSLVVKSETISIVMAITAADDLKIIQFDIKTAFLHGDIAEILYMEQPEGFVDPYHPHYVCLL